MELKATMTDLRPGPVRIDTGSGLPRMYYDLTWKRKKRTVPVLSQDPGPSVPTEPKSLSATTILPTTLPSISEEILQTTAPNEDTPTSSAKRSTKKRKK